MDSGVLKLQQFSGITWSGHLCVGWAGLKGCEKLGMCVYAHALCVPPHVCVHHLCCVQSAVCVHSAMLCVCVHVQSAVWCVYAFT